MSHARRSRPADLSGRAGPSCVVVDVASHKWTRRAHSPPVSFLVRASTAAPLEGRLPPTATTLRWQPLLTDRASRYAPGRTLSGGFPSNPVGSPSTSHLGQRSA